MFNNRNNDPTGGYILLLLLGIGFIIIPIICMIRVLTDGWENCPRWMQFVAVFSYGYLGSVLVILLLRSMHLIA